MDFPKWFANMLKQNACPEGESKATIVPSRTLEVVQSTSTKVIDTTTVFTGPKGGKYRLNSKGNKVYLSA